MDNFTSAYVQERSVWFLPSSCTTVVAAYVGWSSVVQLLIAYPFVCWILRWRRLRAIERPFVGRKGRKLSSMTDVEANKIIKQLSRMEFPTFFALGYQMALFRTYGIPSISKLLAATTEISSSGTVGRRYADTTAIMAEIYNNAPPHERHQEAYARLNFLHGNYIKKGLISNDDMLYTLSLFMNNAFRTINRYEWRQLSQIEKCAFGVTHRQMARNMKIDLSSLSGYESGWEDGAHFFDDVSSWALRYEEEAMVPSPKNFQVADATRRYFLDSFPSFMQGAVSAALPALMDPRLCKAIMFEEASPTAAFYVNTFLSTRKFLLRYLALPRPEFMQRRLVPDELGPDKRIHFQFYEALPFFIKPTLWNRWGPGAWLRWFRGVALPGDKGMSSEGYLTRDVGPVYLRGKGHDEMEIDLKRLRTNRGGGCPFAMGG